jgi:hypothetical protein
VDQDDINLLLGCDVTDPEDCGLDWHLHVSAASNQDDRSGGQELSAL